MSEILPRFIDALQQANLDVTGREVAEILWLALQMSTATEEVVRAPEQDGNLSQPSGEVLPSMDTKPSSQPTSKSSSAKTKPTSEVHLHSQKSSSKSKGYQGAILARMPAAQALGETLVLGRALRPLRRRYPSRKTLVLNVQATVRRIAEMQKRVWEPVVEPALMRWFDLALVIDEGASMIFWQQTITELRTLFEQLGALRDIRVWRLATNQKEEIQLYAGTRASTVQQPARNPKELIDPTGRRLILVVTDCVSPAWYSGKVQEVLELWGQKNLVTLLHMFPRRLWPRTALCAAQTARISASAPGMANVHLKTPGARSRLATELSMPIPVVTLDQKSLASWSRIVLGAESTGASGIMFAKDISKVFAETASMQEDEDALTPQERVRDFWAAASPTARRLARLLSARPISLPIVHLIQQTMLSERKPEHVAEVFLGGLLKEIYRDHTTTHPEYIEYEFLPGVKEELFNALPMPDEYQVLREISRFVENRLGLSRDFLGRIALPTSSEGLTIDPESRPFARIATTVWRKLGGDYAAYADKLDQMLNGHSTQPIEVPTEFREAGEELQSEVKREIVSTAPTSPSVHYTTAKVALVGDSGVGKTGLGYRIAEERFQVTESTHGQQFWVVDKLSTTRNDGAQCEAVLWDFAGQPKFRAIHALFLDDVDLALVLFDPARPDTFTGVDYWLKQLSYQGRLYPTILVAARTDVSKLSISSTELESFCRERNISGGFIATSAKTGAGVNELLEMIRQQIDWN